MTCEEAKRLADAYADGELALDAALSFEAHVEHCAACRARLDEIQALKRELQAAPYFRAPESMARRLRSVPPRANRWRPWLLAAASVAVIALTSAGLLRQRAVLANDRTADAVIEGHVRSLMANHLTDVTSTDRHTVKPWFAGRVDFSPVVVDLAADGFPLSGGRVDYIDHHAAAALIYMRREHAINVFLWPQADGSASRVIRSDARGYHVISWTRGGVAVWIVSDLALAELNEFAGHLDAALESK
jgi:anti-sigma factor RsiW